MAPDVAKYVQLFDRLESPIDAERFREAGITTVATLAVSDARQVADAASVSTPLAKSWIDCAGVRVVRTPSTPTDERAVRDNSAERRRIGRPDFGPLAVAPPLSRRGVRSDP